jgi:hypothetical protein
VDTYPLVTDSGTQTFIDDFPIKSSIEWDFQLHLIFFSYSLKSIEIPFEAKKMPFIVASLGVIRSFARS